jgi:hypothetical protein
MFFAISDTESITNTDMIFNGFSSKLRDRKLNQQLMFETLLKVITSTAAIQ